MPRTCHILPVSLMPVFTVSPSDIMLETDRASCHRLVIFFLLFLFGRRWETVCVKCNPITENENLFPVVDRKIRESYILLRQKMTDDVHPLPNLGDHLWFNYSPLFFCFCHLSHSPLVLFPSLIAYQLFPRLLVLFFHPSYALFSPVSFLLVFVCDSNRDNWHSRHRPLVTNKKRGTRIWDSTTWCFISSDGLIGSVAMKVACPPTGLLSILINYVPLRFIFVVRNVMKCTWRDACSFLSFFFACASL